MMYGCIVFRLSTQNADQLYQRLETLVREVVIEMKVKLLKELTVDQKAIHRAHQFLSLLLSEYYRLCTASQRAATILSSFVCVFRCCLPCCETLTFFYC